MWLGGLVTTRRTFLKGVSIGAGTALLGNLGAMAFAADTRPLLDRVADVLDRLAPGGWRQLLLEVSAGQLDITARDLKANLSQTLSGIDRTYPGFGDFDATGGRAIEAGRPELSLLYHALASPTVVALKDGAELGAFPTLAEIETIEDYCYGVEPPILGDIRARAAGHPLAIVVFAVQYRNTPMSVHGKSAELCFARTGVARLGTLAPQYDGRRRAFLGGDPDRPFDYRVVPQRFVTYLAAQMKGDMQTFGPQDALEDDVKRDFWVPLHKLFNGPECIAGFNLELDLSSHLFNEKLRRFHRFMEVGGFQSDWSGQDLQNFPFVIRDEMIGRLSDNETFGSGLLQPKPQPLVVPAHYNGKPLNFFVDGEYSSDADNLEYSSLQLLPGPPDTEPEYTSGAAQSTQRPAPEYINIRHRVLPSGQVDNLNHQPDLMNIIRAGGYQTEHYIDFAGDGWIEARCSALENEVAKQVPAYCIVGPPDFFPKVNQRDLMEWWRKEVPKAIRDGLWAIEPWALSQVRIAANIELPIGFSINDTTVTAIVTSPKTQGGDIQAPNGPLADEYSGMPELVAGSVRSGLGRQPGHLLHRPR